MNAWRAQRKVTFPLSAQLRDVVHIHSSAIYAFKLKHSTRGQVENKCLCSPGSDFQGRHTQLPGTDRSRAEDADQPRVSAL